MKPETKAKLQKVSDEADTITDGILLRASQSKWTWVVVAAYGLGAFVLGAVLF